VAVSLSSAAGTHSKPAWLDSRGQQVGGSLGCIVLLGATPESSIRNQRDCLGLLQLQSHGQVAHTSIHNSRDKSVLQCGIGQWVEGVVGNGTE
jgi:hypothetical protein